MFGGAVKKSKALARLQFYEAPESTSAWAERQYWNKSDTVIALNSFWNEWIGHNGGPFISEVCSFCLEHEGVTYANGSNRISEKP